MLIKLILIISFILIYFLFYYLNYNNELEIFLNKMLFLFDLEYKNIKNNSQKFNIIENEVNKYKLFEYGILQVLNKNFYKTVDFLSNKHKNILDSIKILMSQKENNIHTLDDGKKNVFLLEKENENLIKENENLLNNEKKLNSQIHNLEQINVQLKKENENLLNNEKKLNSQINNLEQINVLKEVNRTKEDMINNYLQKIQYFNTLFNLGIDSDNIIGYFDNKENRKKVLNIIFKNFFSPLITSLIKFNLKNIEQDNLINSYTSIDFIKFIFILLNELKIKLSLTI